jgi:hypothetical protein
MQRCHDDRARSPSLERAHPTPCHLLPCTTLLTLCSFPPSPFHHPTIPTRSLPLLPPPPLASLCFLFLPDCPARLHSRRFSVELLLCEHVSDAPACVCHAPATLSALTLTKFSAPGTFPFPSFLLFPRLSKTNPTTTATPDPHTHHHCHCLPFRPAPGKRPARLRMRRKPERATPVSAYCPASAPPPLCPSPHLHFFPHAVSL